MSDPSEKSPTVSVLMSVYNGGAYLPPCIDSILGQTFKDFEFIIIDDGSKDDSPAVLKEYADRDSRIRLVVRANKGLTKTLNEAYKLSRGKYLARMDCDDVAVPTRFAAQVAFLGDHPDVACTGGYFQLIDGESRLLTTLKPPTDDAAIQADCLAGHNPICHPSAMIRRTAMDAVNGYDERFKTTQDLDLWLRLGEVGKLANVPEVVLKFRLHESSVSETKRQEQRKAGELACSEAWERRKLPPERRKYEASEPWRPGKDRSSRHQHALQYGWWAYNSGEKKTARHYGWKAIGAKPLSPKGWKLVAVATLK
ncbi:glycosyltransferase family 2 protein [Humisphaera borealis]|uniref:Glycosyltransferase n=1 Tax=Humisphaera borealis TaxID=2807512 RepID=A0A7M2WT25_9BACT|nr:glycosyltransferase [Humisphaera borealis]QOV87971.1 glycosyltransferase [Humisphaera borealis]